MKSFPSLAVLLLSCSLAAQAQTEPVADGPARRGELTGARPSRHAPARPRQQAGPAPASRAADPVQDHLLNESINLARARAEELPELYDHFISTTRAERKSWSYRDWDAAAAVLGRLNQRYEEVRTELPLEERVRIRAFQGEFHTLRGARKVSDKVGD